MEDKQQARRLSNQSQRHKDETERVKRCNRRRKRVQRQIYMAFGVAVLLLIISVILIFTVRGCRAGTNSLTGKWDLDGTTTYKFDGKGNGAMVLPSVSYDFTYTINGDELVIDFVNDTLRDSTYKFTIKKGVLTMTGGEGTAGGIYKLKKISG